MSVWSRIVSGEKDGVAGLVPATVPRDIVGTIELLAGFATVTRANGICIVLNPGDSVFQGDVVETAADSHITIRFVDDTAFSLSASASVVLREFTNDQASPSALFDLERGTFAFSAGQIAKAGRLRIETPVATIRGRMRSGGIGILSLSTLFFAALEKAEAVSGSLNPDDSTIECRDMGQYGVVELVPHGRPQPQFLSACEVIHILANGSSEASPLSAVQMVQLQAQQQETLQLYRLGLQVPTLSGPGGSSTNPNFLLPELVKPINFVVPENNIAPQNSLNSSIGPNNTTSDTFQVLPPPPPPPPPPPVTPAPVPELPGQTNDPNPHETAGTLAGQSISVSDPSFVWSNGSLSDPQLQSLRDASTLSLPLGSTDFTFSIPDNALDFLAAGETLTVIYNVTITDGNGNNLTQQIVITAAGSEDIPQITAATDNSLAELAGTNNETTHAVSGEISFADVDLTDRPTVTAPFASYSYLAANGTTALTLTAAQQSAVETALTITPDAGNANNGSAGWTYSVPDHVLDFLGQDETLTLTYTGTVDDGHGGVVTTPITVTIHGTNDVPVIAAGTTATGDIHGSGQGDSGSSGSVFTLAPAVSAVSINGSGSNALVNGLGGSEGFGENTLAPNDDGSTGSLDITAIFGPTGLNFFGHNYTIVYVNNNGNVTFGNPLSTFTPDPIGTNLGFPIIAPFWGDVDTRGGSATATPGGNSTGSDLVYYDFDTVNGVFTVTWDDVGYYSNGTDKLNAFQLQLINQGNGNFDIVFRYEDISWTAGNASGGSGGLGGTAARAGYSAGDGNSNHSFELPESGIQADMLALPDTPSNTANPGVFEFHVRNGVVVSEQLTATGVIDFTDPDYTDTHTATFVAEGANYVGMFVLDPITQDSSNGATGQVGWSFSADDSALAYLAAGESVVQRYDVTIDDGHGGTTTQTVAITITGTNDAPVITSETQSGAVTEIADNAPGENTTVHSQSGTITYSDVDNLDSHTASFVPAASNTTALGTFALDPSSIDTGNGGSIGWTFTVSDGALDYLQAGQVVSQAYDVTVDDGHGGTAMQTVTVTITGTEDAPVITSETQSGAVTEIADNAPGENTAVHSQSGAITYSDVDNLDSHTASFAPAASNTTTLGTFALDPSSIDSGNGGSIGWTFTVPDSALDYLQAGQVVTQAYDVTVNDGHGGTATQTVTITIHGSNDAPVIGGTSTGNVTEDDGAEGVTAINLTTSGALSIGDPDAGQSNFSAQAGTAGSNGFGTFTLDAGGNWTYTADNTQSAIQQLGAGDTLTDSFTAVSSDGTANRLVTVTITGTNDAPVITNESNPPHATEAANASAQNISAISGTVTVTDLDIGDSLTGSVTGNATALLNGGALPGGVDVSALIASGAVSFNTVTTNGGSRVLTWTYDPGVADLDWLKAGDALTINYTAQVNDGHGNVGSQALTITIDGTNDVPVITNENNPPHVTEAANASAQDIPAISGTVTVTDLDIGDSLTGSVTGNATALLNGGALPSGVDVSALIASGAVSFNTVTTNGGSRVLNWTYDPGAADLDWLKAGDALTINYTAQVNDGHGNVGSQALMITIDGTNDAPVVGAGSAAVSEEGLPNGNPDTVGNPDDSTDGTTASGTIAASDADGDALTWTLGNPGPALTSGGQPVTWSGQGTGTLVGSVGATPILTVTIDNAGHYNVTLSGPIDHPDHTSEDVKTIDVPVNVYDGHTTTATTLSVDIEDDSPKAALVSTTIAPTDSNTNVMLILDLSGSMAFPSGLPGLSRLDVEKAAVNELLDQYDSRGNVMVRLITFSGTANSHGSVWMSVAAAKAAIAGLTAGGITNYDAGLLTAMSAFTGAGKLPAGPATQNVSYFLSDGSPTANSDWPDVPGSEHVNGIQPDEQAYWENFLTTNDIISFAVGVGSGVTTAPLNPIAFDPAPGTQLADTPIVVTNLSQLAATLVFSIPPISGAFVAGINGASDGSFGADGGHMQSITVDGVTYTFHPTTNTITTSNGSTANYDGTTLTVDTDPSAIGGELAVVMTTGAFTFQPTQNFTSESVGYVLVDGDGDTAGNTVVISASGVVAPAGVAGEAMSLGLTNPVGHVGAMNVSIAGLPAGWSLSEGTDNGDGSWTVQSNDIAALTVVSPADYTGALALHVTESWTNADGSNALTVFTDNVEAYAPGNPIFAISGNDHLTGSSAADLFVFAQPIGVDIVHNFDVAHDQIDLIGYAGFTSFADVQAHLANDGNGDAVLTLADGQSITFAGVDAGLFTAGDFIFDHEPVTNNTGSMVISDGALLPLSGVVNNSGAIVLDAAGNGTELELIQHGITLQDGGTLTLSDSADNAIFGTGTDVLFTNVDNTISGAGHLGEGQMMLANDGTIIATGINALEIDTGANTVVNAGTLEATGTGGLHVYGDVANDGLLWANGGDLAIDGNVSGNGSMVIEGAATIELGGTSSESVTFANDVPDSFGRLVLNQAASYSGDIYNFTGTNSGQSDAIDLKGITFDSGLTFAYHDNVGNDTGGMLTIFDTADGAGINAAIDSISFANGDYTTASFALSSDGQGGTLITNQSALTTAIDTTATSLSTGADATLTSNTSGGSYNNSLTGIDSGDTSARSDSDVFIFKAIADSQASADHSYSITDFTIGPDHVDAAIDGLTNGAATQYFDSADVEFHLNHVSNVQSGFIIHH